VVVAARAEAEAVIRGLERASGGGVGERVRFHGDVDWRARPVGERFDLVLSGVGKANAAGAVARVFVAPRHGGVLSIGFGGGFNGLNPGDAVVASESLYGDEGAIRPAGWETAAAFGFPAGAGIGEAASLAGGGMGVRSDEELVAALRHAADAADLTCHVGPVATVSTCSGVGDLADRVRERTGAAAEAMEGAAVGLTAKRLDPEALFAECRIISNHVGPDPRWDAEAALAGLERLSANL